MKRIIGFFIVTLWSVAAVIPAMACNKIAGLTDVNCDRQLRVAVIGDSIVYGVGDQANNGYGGYVKRISALMRKVTFSNLGVPGWTTRAMLSKIDAALVKKRGPKFASAVLKADIVILDIGRNDRWRGVTPQASYRNLQRARALIRAQVLSAKGVEPLVITSVLLVPNRGSQAPWVRQLNKIIAKNNSLSAPADLRYDKVSAKYYTEDRLHPSSQGYAAIAKVLYTYLSTVLPLKILQQEAEDTTLDPSIPPDSLAPSLG